MKINLWLEAIKVLSRERSGAGCRKLVKFSYFLNVTATLKKVTS